MLSKPLKVVVYICIASKSAFERFAHKDAACKTEAFLYTLFLENEAQMDQNNYGTMLFMSKQVSLPKISSILQKVKIGQKPIYALSEGRPLIAPFLYYANKETDDLRGGSTKTVQCSIRNISRNIKAVFSVP